MALKWPAPVPPVAGVLLRGALLVVAGFACFQPALRGGWLWDDDLEIARHPLLPLASGWWRAWAEPAGLDYFPLKDDLHWLQWRLWGADPLGYHVTSLALHLLAAGLLWRLLAKLGAPGAWLGGLWFAIHPLTVESVAWLAESKNTFSLPLLLGALLAYLNFEHRRRRRDYVLALALFLAALLCKTSGVMLPVVILLHAWWRRGRVTRADGRAAAPFFALALLLGLVTVWFQKTRAMGGLADQAPLVERVARAARSLAVYCHQALFPAGLSPVYGPDFPRVPVLLGATLLLAGLVATWRWRGRGGRMLGFGLGWFGLNLLPVLGVIPMSYMRVAPHADHLVYLALAGIVALAGIAAGWGWRRASGHPWARAGVAGACVSLSGFYLLQSRAYARAFVDEAALWRTAVERQPGAWLAQANWGRALLRRGEYAAAEEHLERARALQPGSAEVRVNLGEVRARTGRPREALADYAAAVALDPRFAGAHYNLGQALLVAGRTGEAIDQLRQAIALQPDYATAHNNLGIALARSGRLDEAGAEYQRALALDPRLAEAHLNLGNLLLRRHEGDAAIAEYRRALALDPGLVAAHRNLATAWRLQGRGDEAEKELAAARRAP